MSKRKMIVTDYETICIFCGKPSQCVHHLIFGISLKELADEDGLVVPSCNNCHNLGQTLNKVHDNPMAEKLSKMLGQAIYEAKIGTREDFKIRYGKSYL